MCLFVGPLLHASKLWGGVVGLGGVVAHEILVSAQGPLVLGLGQKGLGRRALGQGLTKFSYPLNRSSMVRYSPFLLLAITLYHMGRFKLFSQIDFKLFSQIDFKDE